MSKDKVGKTLILGATTNPERYAFKAAERLHEKGFEFVPVGVRQGQVFGEEIIRDRNPISGIETMAIYVGPARQKEWYDYIVATKPTRVILNPGTENEELKELLESNSIDVIENCTLVMLSLGIFPEG